MVRDIANRYKGLPERSPDKLFQIIGKFTRGAVSHYDVIMQKKADVKRAYQARKQSGNDAPLIQALTVLFWEFHFYVTCWLQIELALYRLSRHEETKGLREVFDRFRSEIDRHLHVRRVIDDTEKSVLAQFHHFGAEMACVKNDSYWFQGIYFTVDEASIAALQQLYAEIADYKKKAGQES